MAVVRARSSPPYGLIVFVFLTVISTGIAIWLGVKSGDLQKQLDEKSKQMAILQKSGEVSQRDAILRGAKGQSVVGAASEQLKTLKNLVTLSSETKTADQVANEARNALVNVGYAGKDNNGTWKDSLVSAITDIDGKLRQQQALVATLQAEKKNLEDQRDQAATASKGAADTATANFTQLTTQLTAANNAAAEERKKNQDAETSHQGALTKSSEEIEQLRRERILERKQFADQLAIKDQTIETLRQQIKGPDVVVAAPSPSGTIIRARAGTGECYISLGQKDRIVVGLTFSVHDQRIGVRGQGEQRGVTPAQADLMAAGKGSIEVIEVGENESLCRITHVARNETIQAGDLIYNFIYQNNKNRKTHFVVRGEFDLDGDGTTTANERDRVVAMITKWGGVIDETLSPQTDYLILGTTPAGPSTKAETQPGSVPDKLDETRKQISIDTVEAKRSSVPILNANRFLAMIGYYNTSIVR